MAWISVSLEYSFFQSSVDLTGKVVVPKNWITDIISPHSVTRGSDIWGINLELLKLLLLIERGRGNWIILLRVASIEKTNTGLVMRVLGTS